MNVFRRFLKGIQLLPNVSDPSDNKEGSIWYNSSDTELKSYLDSSIRSIVTNDQVQTLENKGIGDSNTILAQTDAFEIQDHTDNSKAIDFDISAADASTVTTLKFLQTVNRTIEFFDDDDKVVGETVSATLENKELDFTAATGNNTISADSIDILYDNSASGLTATEVQSAIDEIITELPDFSDFANKNLSNLASVQINTNLLFSSASSNIGDQTNFVNNLYVDKIDFINSGLEAFIDRDNNVLGNGGFVISTNATSNSETFTIQTRTALSNTNTTGDLFILTGNHNASGDTGNIRIKTGDADTENSGDIIIESGTAGTTRGILDINVSEIDVNNVQILNVVDPTSDQMAATKKYVDDTLALSGGVPVGTPIPSFATSTPTGYLYCDGSTVSRTTYSALFAAIGTSCGEGDGSTTFHLPDLRGMFLRGQDDSRGIDLDKNARTAQATGGNEDDNVGSQQSDQTAVNSLSIPLGGSHSHNAERNATRGVLGGFNANGGYLVDPNGSSDYAPTVASGIVTTGSSNHTHTLNGGSETRPKNIYVRYYIKY